MQCRTAVVGVVVILSACSRSPVTPSVTDHAAVVPRPHEPPAFDGRRVDQAPREIVLGPQAIGFTGLVNNGWSPPDPQMAVGPDHIVLIGNGAIAFFTKEGTPLFEDEIAGPNGFWGELGATGSVFDPERSTTR